MIDKINKQISDYFGDIHLFVVEDNKSRYKWCDITLAEDWMMGRADTSEPEALRNAVAAYIFHENPDVQTIAYGGVYYSRESILVAIFRGYGHKGV